MQNEPRVSIQQLQKLSAAAQKRFSDWFIQQNNDNIASPQFTYLPDASDKAGTLCLPMFTIGEILTCFEELHPQHADLSYLFTLSKLPTPQAILDHLWSMLAMLWEELPQQFLFEFLQKNGHKLNNITFKDYYDAVDKFAQERGLMEYKENPLDTP